ncbi:MAG: transposase [Deltaproteobacteria bacterium]|nr:transposase [Deltaproteobacteria bacterium]
MAYRVKYEVVRGTTHRVMTPMEFMARLAALVPPPWIPLVRYHGVLAPNSPWRAVVVPGPRPKTAAHKALAHPHEGNTEEKTQDRGVSGASPAPSAGRHSARRSTQERLDWATLLHRVWGVDARPCPRCGEAMRFIAVITDRAVIVRILEHLGLPADEPRAARARDPTWDFAV